MSNLATSEPQKKKFPFVVRVEPRLTENPKWLPGLLSLVAVVVALLIGAVILTFVGGDPWKTYAHIGAASFGS